MKVIVLTAIILVAALTATAQYFRQRIPVVRENQNYTFIHVVTTYTFIKTPWRLKADALQTTIESPIIIKKLPSYRYSTEHRSSPFQLSSLAEAKRYHNKKAWQDMNLRPLIDLAYSLYNPRYIPTGN